MQYAIIASFGSKKFRILKQNFVEKKFRIFRIKYRVSNDMKVTAIVNSMVHIIYKVDIGSY